MSFLRYCYAVLLLPLCCQCEHTTPEATTSSSSSSSSSSTPDPAVVVTSPSNSSDQRFFLYFAYGSNLLRERLRLNSPSAVFVTTGRLKDHALRFGHWRSEGGSEVSGRGSWNGGVATVVEEEGEEVWGAVWRMHLDHLTSLDRQEGVRLGFYSPREVTIVTEGGGLLCRTYQMNNYTSFLTSPPYKQVVCLGARQSGLPLDYIQQLEAVETNGYTGPSILDDITTFRRPSSIFDDITAFKPPGEMPTEGGSLEGGD